MEFDPYNAVVKLCAQGMDQEGLGQAGEASKLFQQAWNLAISDVEKFTAAHYVARHQPSVADKLKWDETALQLAQKINSDAIKDSFPSLYLNIAKGYEDLSDYDQALKGYQLAFSFTSWLPDNGYGNMVKTAILNGIERVVKCQAPVDNNNESLTPV
jgi:hypothetical protein